MHKRASQSKQSIGSKSLPVVWDSIGLTQRNSGIFTYANELKSALLDLNIQINTKTDSSMLAQAPGNKVFSPLLNFKYWEHKFPEGGVYHGLANINIPLFFNNNNWKFVLTIHDLTPLMQKQSSFYSIQMKLLLPQLLNKAEKVICISNWTKRCLHEHFSVDESKVVVIPPGFNGLNPIGIEASKPKGEKLKILFVGRWERYKNFDLLIKLSEMGLFELTVVSDSRGCTVLSSSKIKTLSDLTKQELSTLYSQSDVYVHPSYYEGFCLPFFEALSHGTPVVFTQGHALDDYNHEGVALSVEKDSSVLDWASAINQISRLKGKDSFLKKRDEFLDSLPTWAQVAQLTKSIYTSIV